MRLFAFFRKIIGSDETSRIEKIDSRISELDRNKSSLDKELEQSRNTKFWGMSRFRLAQLVSRHPTERKVFTPRAFGNVRTMQELSDDRKREEEKRIISLKEKARNSFETVRNLLTKEDVNSAEDILYQVTPILSELKDEAFHADFKECKNQIESLKEELLQREIERQEQEKKQQEERRQQKERQRQTTSRMSPPDSRSDSAKKYEDGLREAEQEEQKERERIAKLTAEVTRKKKNDTAFITYLKSKGVKYFYHFTNYNNLKSIKEHGGLYSWHYCENHDIKIPDAGGDYKSRELDLRQGLQDYVRLSFCSDHPMQYRKKNEGAHLVLLKIKIDVAAFADTQFSDVNAAANNNIHGASLEDLRRVDIRATQKHYVKKEDPDFHKHQAECMVKTFIPIEYITNIDLLIQNHEEEVQPKRRRRRR